MGKYLEKTKIDQLSQTDPNQIKLYILTIWLKVLSIQIVSFNLVLIKQNLKPNGLFN